MKPVNFAAALLSTTLLAGAAQAQVSDDVIKIGVMNDQSGLYADLAGQGSVTAAQMAVDEMGGTVAGKKIEIISADHQNKPDVGASIAREWFDVEGVDVMVDVPTSSVALAVQEVSRDKKKPFLIVGAATTRLTGEDCSAYGVHWMYDTYALAVGTGRAMVQEGGDSWFFITADYAFGHSLEQDTGNVVKESGGQVLGAVRHPLSSTDFSSYLLQAQASGAKVIGLANAGSDTTNSIKQANEFGIVAGGQKLASLLIFLTDIDSLGLDVAKGLVMTTGYYWDQNDQAREWAEKFNEKHGAMPTMVQAGVYSAVLNYLKAVDAAGSDGGDAVMAELKEMEINDPVIQNGKIRADGRLVHDMYLAEVKSPEESSGKWDYLKVLRTIPGDEAYLPLSESKCPLVKQ